MMVNRLLSGLLLVFVLIGFASAVPPAPTGGHVVPPSTPSFSLTVTIGTGTGSGTVTAAGINCGSDCSESYIQNTIVFLFATPTSGSTFSGWSGACTGTGSCSVLMSAAASVVATFNTTSASATRFASPTGQSTGACTSNTVGGTNGQCDIYRLLTVITCGETGQLNNGTYTGQRYQLQLAEIVPNKSCTAGNEILIQAETDGGVFIDGGDLYTPLWTFNNSYWTFQGFDVGYGDSVAFFDGGSNVTVRRMCFSNNRIQIPGENSHVLGYGQNGLRDSLFEDICLFGTGRTLFTEFNVPGGTNTYRRIWMRWEGHPPQVAACGPSDLAPGTPIYQYQYGGFGNAIFENIITIYDPEQYDLSTWGSWGCGVISYRPAANRRRDGGESSFYMFRGTIGYGYTTNPLTGVPYTTANKTEMRSGDPWWDDRNTGPGGGGGPTDFKDIFLDARSQSVGRPFSFTCEGVTVGTSYCADNALDRVTAIKRTGGEASTFNYAASQTNINECETLGACPNFYLGTPGSSGGSGARNCFEYQDGTLTSTGLWPWRMDDRIKAALARANADGRGGSALSGVAGTGYAANTVTSEIVSRYGAIPTQCLR